MNTVTFNLSFQKDLMTEVDALAKRETRSRSGLLREAARLYIERQKRWDSMFAFGDTVAAASGLLPEDIDREIAAVRKQRTKG